MRMHHNENDANARQEPGGLVLLSALLHFAEHTWLQKFSQLLVPSLLTSYRQCPHLQHCAHTQHTLDTSRAALAMMIVTRQ